MAKGRAGQLARQRVREAQAVERERLDELEEQRTELLESALSALEARTRLIAELAVTDARTGRTVSDLLATGLDRSTVAHLLGVADVELRRLLRSRDDDASATLSEASR